MLASLYRNLIPYRFRNFIYSIFLGRLMFVIRNFNVIARSKYTFLFGFLLPKTETNKALSFMGRHGITSYPYPYSLEYKNKTIPVERDIELNLPFVIHNGRKLYFPEFYTDEKVQKDYRALIIEQDIRAAHRYVRSYEELKNRTLLDVGAAEAIFALDTIELTQRVVIFEIMEHWQKPLHATFRPWTNKVSIVRKYVSDNSSGDCITLDEFLGAQPKENLFIKMDIEGAERSALAGGMNTLRSGKNIQLAVCTYHRPGDPEHMENLFRTLGFKTEFSDGLMYWNRRVSKGVIRAWKFES